MVRALTGRPAFVEIVLNLALRGGIVMRGDPPEFDAAQVRECQRQYLATIHHDDDLFKILLATANPVTH